MSPDQPLVSVVIACFNCAALVTQTLDSLMRQTHRNLEVIAVDDESTDATREVLDAYRATEPRLRIIHKSNGGCASARNAGIAAAKGQFIAVIDADDLWAPNYVEAHLARFADDPELGVSFTPVRFISFEGTFTGEVTRPKLHGITPQDLLEGNPAGCAMMIARRQVFDDVGPYNPQLRRAEDQEWLFRVTLSRWRIGGYPEALADYRNSPSGLSADLEAQRKAYLELLEHVRKLAPDVVARGYRRAVGTMLHYMARRAIRLGKGADVVRHYLTQALRMAPSLLIRKPVPTLAMLVAAYVPGTIERMRPAPSA